VSNVECTGYPHSQRLGCGWTGERFPRVRTIQELPDPRTGRPVLTNEWIDAVAAKPCPRCGGIVLPIPSADVAWPAEVEREVWQR